MSDAASIHAAKGDQVRAATKPTVQQKIDNKIREQIIHFASQPKEVITRRIFELENEWDIERVLEANAAGIGLASLVWGLTVNKKCLAVTATVLGFLMLHSTQGWCPPVPLLRRMGVRTRREIDRELFALKVLRGDFQTVGLANPDADAALSAVEA
jgi:hypothetical protein